MPVPKYISRSVRYDKLHVLFRSFYILCTAILFQFSAFAQKEKIDSLKKLPVPANDTSQINRLNELSDAYSFVRTDSMRIIALQALQKAEKINYAKGIGVACKNIARANWLLGQNLPEMEAYCRKAILRLQNTEHKNELAQCWFILGYCLGSQCIFSTSIDAYQNAISIFSILGDELSTARTYAYMADVERGRGYYTQSLAYSEKMLAIANKYKSNEFMDVWASLYKEAGDYVTAIEYYRLAAQHSDSSAHLDELMYFNYAIGEVLFLQGKYDSANYYYKKILAFEPANTKMDMHFGELQLALKNYDTALHLLNKTWQFAKNSGNRWVQMLMLQRLGKAYLKTANINTALQRSSELLQIARQTGARQFIRDGHFLLYETYKETEKKDSAFWHLQQHTLIKDTLDKDLSVQQLSFHKLKTQKEKDQARIDLLNEEKKLQQQQQLKQKSQQTNFLIAGIAALCLFGVLLFRIIILKRKHEKIRLQQQLSLQQFESEKKNAELQQQKTELEMQALRAQMNPHFIFNSLNSINRFILQNDKLQASEYLSKFSKLVRLILHNSQASLITLESELESLKLYLELEVLRFDDHFTFKIIVDDALDTDMIKVPPLLIQPYAENAIWHGLMHKEVKGFLEINLFTQHDMLCCKITDDGVGREKATVLRSTSASAHKSMGMRITAERIAMLLQQNKIKNSVQVKDIVLPDGSAAGTEVLLTIPLMYA